MRFYFIEFGRLDDICDNPFLPDPFVEESVRDEPAIIMVELNSWEEDSDEDEDGKDGEDEDYEGGDDEPVLLFWLDAHEIKLVAADYLSLEKSSSSCEADKRQDSLHHIGIWTS